MKNNNPRIGSQWRWKNFNVGKTVLVTGYWHGKIYFHWVREQMSSVEWFYEHFERVR
jgi:hypothetical protein